MGQIELPQSVPGIDPAEPFGVIERKAPGPEYRKSPVHSSQSIVLTFKVSILARFEHSLFLLPYGLPPSGFEGKDILLGW